MVDSIGWCQQTRGGRRRASAAATYLRPAKKRANLQIVTNALVHRVVFDGRRAVGLEFSRQSGLQRVDAARGVIPLGGRDRLAASPAAIGRRRARGAAEGGYRCARLPPREKSVRNGLAAGGDGLRTIGSAGGPASSWCRFSFAPTLRVRGTKHK
jgi:choline dehydrogenase-like flavoprotein